MRTREPAYFGEPDRQRGRFAREGKCLMDSAQEAFLELMQRVQEGDEQAAAELYESYRAHILKVVRRRLHHPLRNRFDSYDFVQSVWLSFYEDGLEKTPFDGPKELAAFLQKMAV